MINALVTKKFKSEIRIATIISILCLTLVSSMFFISRGASDLAEKTSLREKEIKKYKKTIGEDVDALLKLKESLRLDLQQKYNQLKGSLSKSDLKAAVSATPLSFKKRLFEVREKIAERAKQNKILLPQELGFEEYRLKLPDASLVPVLLSELSILEEISSILINDRVFAVRSIKLPHEVELLNKKTHSLGKVPFKSLSIQLSVETDFDRLKRFLLDLAGSENNYVVWKIDVKKIDGQSGRLLADMKLKCIEL